MIFSRCFHVTCDRVLWEQLYVFPIATEQTSLSEGPAKKHISVK